MYKLCALSLDLFPPYYAHTDIQQQRHHVKKDIPNSYNEENIFNFDTLAGIGFGKRSMSLVEYKYSSQPTDTNIHKNKHVQKLKIARINRFTNL
uniref:Uncharacterized protein n=1 Tax=Acrobeloides nanus TaxID=290746 RepID=A0A914DE78_9BILA